MSRFLWAYGSIDADRALVATGETQSIESEGIKETGA